MGERNNAPHPVIFFKNIKEKRDEQHSTAYCVCFLNANEIFKVVALSTDYNFRNFILVQ